MEKRKNRSDRYQWLLLETVCSHEQMEAFSNDSSIYSHLNPFEYNEDLIDLEEELKKEFWRIADENLTQRQNQVLRMWADGYTQMEIAKILGVNQSSITKSINGNTDYKNKKRISYGGSAAKLQKIIAKDEKMQEIIKKIFETREAKW